ncbi:fructosamine kinase family protein [soil metagenome]
MDLGYLREHPQNLARLIEHQRLRVTPVPGGDSCLAQRLTLDDGVSVFAKSRDDAPARFFAAEADGLRWLAETGAVPVPDVVAVTEPMLLLTWIDPGTPTAGAAEELGRGLARMHRAGAPCFGAGWAGFIGSLPLDNAAAASWPEFYAEQRVRPYLALARDSGRLSAGDAAVISQAMDRLVDVPVELPSRCHGDLWGGNVLWSAGGPAYLIDPAAHGGHRETDLAMLALFGAPYLDRLMSAYQEEFPLADGWRERVGLHQLHPLLTHAAMFGGGYGARAADAARRSL